MGRDPGSWQGRRDTRSDARSEHKNVGTDTGTRYTRGGDTRTGNAVARQDRLESTESMGRNTQDRER